MGEVEKIYKQVLLYDFYGELLTEHQRNVYEDAVYNDMSLSEIAEEQGISRQGVHDLIKRCDKILQGYEDKLHLVQKFTEAKEKLVKITELTDELLEKELSVSVKESIEHIKAVSTDLWKDF